MTAIEDRPTVGERYGHATESSSLHVDLERRTDADYLIAAGWLENSLGALLFRVQHEYDAVRGEHELATVELQRQEAAARAAGMAPAVIREVAYGAAVTARALILGRLKSLRETKEALARFSVILATRTKFMRPDREVMAVAGQALDVFLCPRCPHCHGRGFNGASHRGEAAIQCRPCEGTGHRRSTVGKDTASRIFGADLLREMDRMLGVAGGGIARALRTDDDPGTIRAPST